jgi:hypothetical protein
VAPIPSIGRWLSWAVRIPARKRKGRRRFPGRRSGGRGNVPVCVAIAAYRRSTGWGERVSRFAHEAAEVPAYEAGARRGERSPQRFHWRGRWYRVADVAAQWQDGRRSTGDRPGCGRAYYNVLTESSGCFQIYYDTQERDAKGIGRWFVYRRTEIRRRRA